VRFLDDRANRRARANYLIDYAEAHASLGQPHSKLHDPNAILKRPVLKFCRCHGSPFSGDYLMYRLWTLVFLTFDI
jgi:hypothetical protein